MRINKYLAACGVAARRGSERFVLEGRIAVNGRVVKDLAFDVNEQNDTVTLDGNKLELQTKKVYLKLNKPKGYICSASDEAGRKTIYELLPDKYKNLRLFSIGRLDYDTEGLIILTNDGDIANNVMHPRMEIAKTYVAKVEGEVSSNELETLKRGVMLDGKLTKRCKARLLGVEDNVSRVEIVISEGRNRQVRRMFEAIGRRVNFLKRTAIGEIKLGGLSRGECKEISENDLKRL